jgi:hypothetical protein
LYSGIYGSQTSWKQKPRFVFNVLQIQRIHTFKKKTLRINEGI